MRRIALSSALFATFMLSFAAADAQERRRLRPFSTPAVPTVEAPAPAEKVFDGKLRQRVMLQLLRHRAVAQMQKDGFKSIGGKEKPLTKEEAEALYDRLTDDVVIGLVKEASPKTWGAIGEGGFLARLIQWIKDHPEEVAAIIKLILTLLAAFAEGQV
jgi:hypothetical protein